MGREVRRVPLDWQHPKDARGRAIPLHEDAFPKRLAEWEEGNRQWEAGMRSDFHGGWIPRKQDETGSYEKWDGPRPLPEDYMPEFPAGAAVGWCMYETTSEGTPISPVFATAEDLARWLADTGASSFASMTATYEQWLATIVRGSAPSAVVAVRADGTGEMRSGVEAMPGIGRAP